MKGRYHLIVQSKHLKYEFDIIRNITIIQGDSATGKTTLVDMIREYELNGADSGINISCDCSCHVLEGNNWKTTLKQFKKSIVFVDEGNRFIASEEFAAEIKNSDNYYILVTRENLYNLPYSVTEVYGIHSSGKYGTLEPVYHSLYRIYTEGTINPITDGFIITEDSNAGFDFFNHLFPKSRIHCISAGGRDQIFECVQKLSKDTPVFVIADGAAFGAAMGKLKSILRRRNNVQLYLPESFEWIILSSDILDDKDVRKILQSPENYIDGKTYFSWERYFTGLLIEKSKNTIFQYSKQRINSVYLTGKVFQKLVAVLPEALYSQT